MEQQERVRGIIAALERRASGPLLRCCHHKKAYELMSRRAACPRSVPTSASTKSPLPLFTRFPTLDAFADADVSEVAGDCVALIRVL